MANVNRAYVNQVIEAASSEEFRAHHDKRKEELNRKLRRLEERLDEASPPQLAACKLRADAFIAQLEAGRDMSRTYAHVDMDAFYAAVEMRDRPELRNVPMGVGGQSMLSTSNYIARRYGVRSAMPGFIAKRLCPELQIVPCNFAKYKAASHAAREIFREYDANFRSGGLDEATLDFTAHLAERAAPRTLRAVAYDGDCVCRLPLWTPARAASAADVDAEAREACAQCQKTRTIVAHSVTFGTSAEEAVREMRFRVEQATGLTCSAGIASNYKLAKICSDERKPDNQFVRERVVAIARCVPRDG